MLKLLRTCYRPACQNMSNAFLKSMKSWNRSRWCCKRFSMMPRLLKISSTVLRPALKPACSSASSSSALAWSRLRISSARDGSAADYATYNFFSNNECHPILIFRVFSAVPDLVSLIRGSFSKPCPSDLCEDQDVPSRVI